LKLARLVRCANRRGMSKLVLTLVMVSLTIGLFADKLADNALAEMKAGNTTTYDVTKSQYRGPTNFRISYPKSWGTMEMARPGVVARIASDNGNGMDSLVIIVRKADSSGKLLQADSLFTPEFFEKFSLPDSKVIRRERVKTKNFDGAVFEYYLTQARAPLTVRSYCSNYLFTQNGAMVQLQFYVLLKEAEDKDTDEARIEAFRPLWEEMLATLTLR
jgi:hypothetical protein